MKNSKLKSLSLSVVGLGCLSLLLAGCNKQTAAVNDATATVTAAASKTADAVAPVADALAPAQNAETNAVDQAKGIIAQAQSLVAANKYTEAAAQLQNLSNLKLSTEQQQLVDGLKQQVQQALSKVSTDGTAKTVGGLLGK